MSEAVTAAPRHDSAERRRATYQDVLDAPPHQVAEIVDGALYTNPRPAAPHALAASALEMDLGPAFQFGRGGPGGWWIIVEPELHLRDDILVPDLAGWRRTRMPSYPETAYFTLAPDWVCEILLIAGHKTDSERFYRDYVPRAAAIYDEYLREIGDERRRAGARGGPKR